MSKILKASIVDFLILTIAIVPIVLSMYIVLINIENHELKIIISKRVDSILGILMVLYLILLIGWIVLRDVFNLSPGKKKYLLIIIDKSTNKEASDYKKMIRNIPLILFPPLEVVIKLIDKKSRLGDMLVNTEIRSNFQQKTPLFQAGF